MKTTDALRLGIAIGSCSGPWMHGKKVSTRELRTVNSQAALLAGRPGVAGPGSRRRLKS